MFVQQSKTCGREYQKRGGGEKKRVAEEHEASLVGNGANRFTEIDWKTSGTNWLAIVGRVKNQ